MIEQYQFQSEDKIVTVEVEDDGSLVFVDYDIQFDLASIEFGYPPTTAALLSELWSDPNPGWAFNACMDNSDFEAFNGWHRLGDSEARVILSYSMSPGDRGSVAANGISFTLEQRIRMATYRNDSGAVATFLVHYGISRDRTHDAYPNPQQRAALYEYLTPDDKWQVVLYNPIIDDNESLDLILGSNNNIRLAALKRRPFTIKHKREMAILNSIDDDETLARALCLVKFVRNYDFINQVKRIKNRVWIDYVLHNAALEEAQMLRLMGF